MRAAWGAVGAQLGAAARQGWDFNRTDAITIEDSKMQASENMLLLVKEKELKEMLDKRTSQEKRKLMFRRIVGIWLNFILILGCWGVIIFVAVCPRPGPARGLRSARVGGESY